MNLIHIFLAEEKQRLTYNLKKYEDAIQNIHMQHAYKFDIENNVLFFDINSLTPELRMHYEWYEKKKIECQTKLHIFYNVLLQHTQLETRSQHHYPLGEKVKHSLSCDQISLDPEENTPFVVQAGPIFICSPREMSASEYISYYHQAFKKALLLCFANEDFTKEEEDDIIKESCTSFFQTEILKKEKGYQKNMQ